MRDPIKILLVDDEARNLDALEAVLIDPSYVLLRADNADLALKLLLEHDVAAILLDIQMAGVSGFELAKLIKGAKKFRHIPIVFLTAWMLEDKVVIAAYGAGAAECLTKPINPIILRHKVDVLADLFRKTRALAALNEQLEARVQERTTELEHASARKDEFIAALSHELRNPLSPILTSLYVLEHVEPGSRKAGEAMAVLKRSTDHLAHIIDDLLDATRIASGKVRLERERLDFGELVQHTVQDYRGLITRATTRRPLIFASWTDSPLHLEAVASDRGKHLPSVRVLDASLEPRVHRPIDAVRLHADARRLDRHGERRRSLPRRRVADDVLHRVVPFFASPAPPGAWPNRSRSSSCRGPFPGAPPAHRRAHQRERFAPRRIHRLRRPGAPRPR